MAVTETTTASGSGMKRELADYYNTLCELDRQRLEVLLNIDFDNEPAKELELKFHEFVTDPFNSACRVIKRFGGEFVNVGNGCSQYPDGQKFICMDDVFRDLQVGNCLIYSFGISDDWSFEDIMDRIGCTIFAFDPTVDFPRFRGNRITFEKIGLSATRNKEENLFSLSEILERNNHTDKKISYLKFDIERHEIKGLPAWYANGAMKHVQQFGFEFHLKTAEETAGLFKITRDLIMDADYRLIFYDLNGHYAACMKQRFEDMYYNQGELVFKKLDNDRECD